MLHLGSIRETIHNYKIHTYIPKKNIRLKKITTEIGRKMKQFENQASKKR